MEVLVSSPVRDFDFDFDFNEGSATSPYLSAPSSPKRFGDYYLSAPASPSRFAEFVSEFEYFSVTPKRDGAGDNGDFSFAFDVSRESENSSLSAEDLFDGGKIKALKTPSRLGADELASVKSPLLSPRRQSRSPMKAIGDALSPKKKETQERRGRERNPSLSSSNSGRRATRSHSPYRNSEYVWEEERYLAQQQRGSKETTTSSSSSTNSCLLASSSGNSKSSRKWRLRDLLLFRSASEGRASNKDPLRKYTVTYKRSEEAKTSSSFRSGDNPGTAHGSSKRRGVKSAHELHYAMKKAETQDLKKKTFLPYKQGILGALTGFGSSTR